ncbi:hypothetical protein Adt_35084 [Abeliophyllum distichum]|uniref:Uncharacterized protein n=1 Tax=Abeliophyllum distichum TaxID=126358 RepID=A0ABD1QDR1_9LAMI
MALPPGFRPNCSLAPPLPPRSMSSLLGPPILDLAKLQLGSSLSSKEHRLTAWPPTWDSAILQLGSFLTSKMHRLAAWPSHLGLGQRVSSSCLALPPGTLPYCSFASPLPPRSIASVLGPPTCDSAKLQFAPPTWDSAKLQLGSFLTSKKHRHAAWPSHQGLGQTSAWLLLYLQGASPRWLALPPGTRLYCNSAPSLPTTSIASLLVPPACDSAKLQLGSFLTSKKYRLATWPSHLGLKQTAAWLIPYLQGASPRCLALPPGTRLNCSLAPPLPLRSIASLLGPTSWDSAKL